MAVEERGPIEGERRRGSFGRSSGLNGRTLPIIRASVMFEERFRIVDAMAHERVSDERVNAPSLVRQELRGESLADTVVIGLDALGRSAAANEMRRAETGNERSCVPCEA